MNIITGFVLVHVLARTNWSHLVTRVRDSPKNGSCALLLTNNAKNANRQLLWLSLLALPSLTWPVGPSRGRWAPATTSCVLDSMACSATQHSRKVVNTIQRGGVQCASHAGEHAPQPASLPASYMLCVVHPTCVARLCRSHRPCCSGPSASGMFETQTTATELSPLRPPIP